MINSILKQQKDRISFEKIICSDTVITKPQQIKKAASTHFQNWTKSNPANNSLWPEWEKYYTPLKNTRSYIYQPLTKPITLEEITNTIKEAPKNKTTGSLGISNEMLQHLPSLALMHLLQIFNTCLQLK